MIKVTDSGMGLSDPESTTAPKQISQYHLPRGKTTIDLFEERQTRECVKTIFS